MKTKKLIIATIICLLICIFILLILHYYGLYWCNTPDSKKYPIRGIDVSHHQGKIDWSIVKSNNKIDFVYVKATEGKNWKDDLYLRNIKEAKKNGLYVGAYHYFTFCRSGRDQAENFINNVNTDDIDLPPAIDLEFVGNCDSVPLLQNLEIELSVFVKLINKHFKMEPIFYLTYESFEKYYKHMDFKNKIWIRSIFCSPKLPDSFDWVIWQYSPRGKIQGIDTYVDLNVNKDLLIKGNEEN